MKSKKAKARPKTAKTASAEEVRSAVRQRYGELAKRSSPCCGGETNMTCCAGIYPDADVISLPSEAIAVSAGCGNPTAIASLRPGMVVVDLKMDPVTENWEMLKRPILPLFKSEGDHELLGG